MKSPMERYRSYLARNGITWRQTEPWALMFSGNHPEGIHCQYSEGAARYAAKLGLEWEPRGNWECLYVRPVEVIPC